MKTIKIYHKGDYLCTTGRSKTCKEAKAKLVKEQEGAGFVLIAGKGKVKIDPKLLTARFN